MYYLILPVKINSIKFKTHTIAMDAPARIEE
jgi:hypothetical protein